MTFDKYVVTSKCTSRLAITIIVKENNIDNDIDTKYGYIGLTFHHFNTE